MASVCSRCKKGKMRGNLVSHAKNRTHRVWRPNLQSYKGQWYCVRCLRSMKKQEQGKK